MSFPKPSTISGLPLRARTASRRGPTSRSAATTPTLGDVAVDAESLGTFAIFYDHSPVTAIETIAGNGVRASSIDGPGGDPSDDFVAGPAKSTPLSYLFGGAFDAARNLLYSQYVRSSIRLNLDDERRFTRIAGNGAILGTIDGPGRQPERRLRRSGHPFNTYVGCSRTR